MRFFIDTINSIEFRMPWYDEGDHEEMSARYTLEIIAAGFRAPIMERFLRWAATQHEVIRSIACGAVHETQRKMLTFERKFILEQLDHGFGGAIMQIYLDMKYSATSWTTAKVGFT